MKTLCYSILTLLLLVRSCNPIYREYTGIIFKNNSNNRIYFTMPCDPILELGTLPDTTMMYYWKYIVDISVDQHASRRIHSPIDTYEEWIPSGLECYSMFVYRSGFPVDYKFYENDEYFVRYDLTLDDIYSLCDENGVLNISYPPSPAMKNIRMWPPYEDVIEQAKN